MTNDPPIKVSVSDFAKRIRDRYPDSYTDVDDAELVERFVIKNPVYADRVDLPSGFKLLRTSSGYKNLDDLYEQAGRKHNVDPNLLLEQGRQETSFDPKVFYGRKVSSAGAKGAGQFMPGTAPLYGVKDRSDPVQSIYGQAKYMRKLLDDFNDDENLALAGYNAGEYRQSLRQGRIPKIEETQEYVKRIGGNLKKNRTYGQLRELLGQQSPMAVRPPSPTMPKPVAPIGSTPFVETGITDASPVATPVSDELKKTVSEGLQSLKVRQGYTGSSDIGQPAMPYSMMIPNGQPEMPESKTASAKYDEWRTAAGLDDTPETRKEYNDVVVPTINAQSQEASDIYNKDVEEYNASLPKGQQRVVRESRTSQRQAGPQAQKPRVAGVATDDLTGIYKTVTVDPKWSDERKLRTVFKGELTGDEINNLITRLRAEGKPLIQTGSDRDRTKVGISRQNIADARAMATGDVLQDAMSQVRSEARTVGDQRMEQAQNYRSPAVSRSNPISLPESQAEKALDKRIQESDYSAQARASRALKGVIDDPLKYLITPWGLASSIEEGVKGASADIDPAQEKARLKQQYGSYSKAWDAEQEYRNEPGAITAARVLNQTARSFAKNLVSGTAKSVAYLDRINEDLNPVFKVMPEEYRPSVRNIVNGADFLVRLVSSGDGATAYREWDRNSDKDDLIATTLFKAANEFDQAVGDDPVLKGRFLGEVANAQGSALSFIALGAVMPSLRLGSAAARQALRAGLGRQVAKLALTDFATGASGSFQMMGTGYEEGRRAGLSETDAKIYGGFQGLLGVSEMVGAGNELAHLIKNPIMRGKLAQSFLELGKQVGKGAAREGKQEFAQELFQTVSGNAVLEYLKDDKDTYQKVVNLLNRLPGQIAKAASEEALYGAITGGATGGVTATSQHVINSNAIAKQLSDVDLRDLTDGEIIESHRILSEGIAEGDESVAKTFSKVEKEAKKRKLDITPVQLQPLNEKKANVSEPPAFVVEGEDVSTTKAEGENEAPVEAKPEPPVRYHEKMPQGLPREAPLTGQKGFEIVGKGEPKATTSIGQITERRKKAEEQLAIDPRTGLGSSTAWSVAQPRIEADPNQEVISLDINRMKDANDTTSHPFIDEKVIAPLGQVIEKVLKKHGISTRNAFTPKGDEAFVAVPKGKAKQIRDEIEKEFGSVEIVAEKDYVNDRTGEKFSKGDVIPVTLSGDIGQTVKLAEKNLDKRKEASKAANPVRRVEQKGQSTQADLRVAFPDIEATVTDSSDGKTIRLDRVVVPKDERGQGKGSAFMNRLVEIADKKGKVLTLTPSTDFGGSSVARLRTFYKQFGFVDNKGRDKDFSISDSMYRPTPKKSAKQRLAEKGKPNRANDIIHQAGDFDVRRSPQGWYEVNQLSGAAAKTVAKFGGKKGGEEWLQRAIADANRRAAEQAKPQSPAREVEKATKESARQKLAKKAKPTPKKSTTKKIVVPASKAKKYASVGLTAAEVQEQISTEEFKKAEALSKTQKEDKNGFTPAQKVYLAKALEDYAAEYPADAPYAAASLDIREKDGKQIEVPRNQRGIDTDRGRWIGSRRAEEIDTETIIVPDDGTFRITDMQQANRLYQKITGKPLKGKPKEKIKAIPAYGRVSTSIPGQAKATNLSRARELISFGLDGDEASVNIPIDVVDADYVAEMPMESDITEAKPSRFGVGWLDISIKGNKGYTDGHFAIVSDKPLGKNPNKTVKSPDFDKMLGRGEDLSSVEPIRAVSIKKGRQVVIEFSDGQLVNFKYYNAAKSRYPGVKFKSKADLIVFYEGKQIVGAVAPLRTDGKDITDEPLNTAVKEAQSDPLQMSAAEDDRRTELLNQLRDERSYVKRQKIREELFGGKDNEYRSVTEGARADAYEPSDIESLQMAAEGQPTFFSQVERTIEAKMPNRASAEQIKGILSPANGVKQEELDWLDIDSFLADLESTPSIPTQGQPTTDKDTANAFQAASHRLANSFQARPRPVESIGSINIPSDAIGGYASFIKRAAVNADDIRNVVNGLSASEQSFDHLPIKAQRLVVASMKAAIHDFEVRRAIVKFVPVDVMNELAGGQFPAKTLLSDPSVLENAFTVDHNTPIPAAVHKATRVLMDSVTFPTAEIVSTVFRLTGKALKGSVTNRTDESDLHSDIIPSKPERRLITKDEVLAYVRANNVQVEEKMRGKLVPGGIKYDVVEKALAASDEYTSEHGVSIDRDGDKFHVFYPGNFEGWRVSTLHGAVLQANRILPLPATKFSQFTLPGGENYRELLLTLPDKTFEYPVRVFDKATGRTVERFAGGLAAERYITQNDPQFETLDYEDDGGKGEAYKSPHWSEPNVLAHVRFDERDGGKTLHISEIQSDWHQEGRKKGYSADLTPEEQELRELQRYFDSGVGLGDDAKRARRSALIAAGVASSMARKLDAVPDAPFKKSWHELVFKRMLRYAAENGYDRITWDTGETQADRYDLSKHVDSVHYSAEQGRLWAIKDNETPIDEMGVKPEDLEKYVGKEVAQKLLDAPIDEHSHDRQTVEGNDLKVGGEGMKGFYDKILPSFANKYTKKWGGKVEADKITTAYHPRRKASAKMDRSPIWSLEITPAMKDAVMQGQPLFMEASDTALSRFKDVQYAHTQTLLEGAKSEIKEVDGQTILELNEEAAELARRTQAEMQQKAVTPFYGSTYTAPMLRKLASTANKVAAEYLELGYTPAQVKSFRTLAANFIELANQAHGVAYVFDFALPHETHHKLVLDALNGKPFPKEVLKNLEALDIWTANPTITTPDGVSKPFKSAYPRLSKQAKAFEIAAMLETGEIVHPDKNKFLDLFARGILEVTTELDPVKFARLLSFRGVSEIVRQISPIPASFLEGGNVEFTPNVIDSTSSALKFLRDITATKTFQEQGLNGFDIVTNRAVMGSVIRSIQDLKIRKFVVEFIPVDVVDVLAGLEPTAQVLLHNPSMFKPLLAIDLNGAVSVRSDVAAILVKGIAAPRTEDDIRRENIRALAKEFDAAVGTGTLDRRTSGGIPASLVADSGTIDLTGSSGRLGRTSGTGEPIHDVTIITQEYANTKTSDTGRDQAESADTEADGSLDEPTPPKGEGDGQRSEAAPGTREGTAADAAKEAVKHAERKITDSDRLFKNRQFAPTLREAGYTDTPDVPYIPDTERQWMDEAQRLIGLGEAVAEKAFWDETTSKQQRTVLGIALMDRAGAMGDLKKVQDIAIETVKHVGTAAQALRAAQVAGKYDFATGMMIAERAKRKGTGKPLTDKELDKLRKKLLDLTRTVEEAAELQYYAEELEEGIAERDQRIADLDAALEEAQQQKELDEKTKKKLERQIAYWKSQKPRTRVYNARKIKELETRLPDLESLLRNTFAPEGGISEESFQMAAPNDDSKIHDAMVDIAAYDILTSKTPEETIEHLRELTGLSDDQLRQIHLEAFESTKGSKVDLDTEARKRIEARRAHQKFAKETRGAETKVRERPDRFDREVIAYGRENGYSDAEILGAITMQKVRMGDVIAKWKKINPGVDYMRAYNLRKQTQLNIKEEQSKERAKKAGMEDDRKLVDNKMKHNRIASLHARRAFDNFARDLSKSWGVWGLDAGVEVVSIGKGLSVWGDVSYVLRQGFIPLLTDTRAAIKGDWQGVGHGLQSNNEMWKFLANKAGYENVAEYLTNHSLDAFIDKIRQHSRFLEAQNSGVRFSQIGDFNIADDQFSSKILRHIPLYQRTEYAYTLPGDLQRLYMFDNWATLIEENKDLTDEQRTKAFKYAAETINAFTGKGDVMKVLVTGGTLAKLLNLNLFSAQLLFSRFQSMNRLTFGFATAPKGLKLQMAKKGLRFYGMLALLGWLSGMILDPDDDDFGQINISKDSPLLKLNPDAKDLHINFLAGMDIPFQMYYRTAASMVKSLVKGDKVYVGDALSKNYQDFVVSKKGEPRFTRSKLSPGASLAVDAVTGTDFIGRPFTWWGGITSRTTPLAWQQTYEALLYDRYKEAVREPRTFEYAAAKLTENERKEINALMVMVGTFSGIGMTQYPKEQTSKALQLAQTLSPAVSKKDAEQLRKEGSLRNLLKMKLELMQQGENTKKVDVEIQRWVAQNPELRQVFDKINSQARDRSGLFGYYIEDLSRSQLERVREVATDPAEIRMLDQMLKRRSQ